MNYEDQLVVICVMETTLLQRTPCHWKTAKETVTQDNHAALLQVTSTDTNVLLSLIKVIIVYERASAS